MGVSLIPAVVAGFGTGTTKKIDTVQNNTEANIVLSPATSVIIDSLTGNFVLQSSGTKEIQESAVTNTELGYLSGATSSVQTQIDSKEPTLPWTTDGDIVKYNGTVASRIAIGAIGTVFSVNAGGLPTWAAPLTQSPTITRGDLIMNISSTAGGDVALPIGTNTQVLTSNGDIASWQDAASASPTTTLGDVIVRGAAEDERLAIGTANQLLTANGTTATWEDAPVSTTLTTKGDIQIFSTENARLPVGPDGSFIVADSTEALGVKYSTYLQGTLNPVSDWTSYIPTGSWTSNTTYTGKYKRIGDSLKVQVQILMSGAPNSVDLSVNLPSGLLIDAGSIISSNPLSNITLGLATLKDISSETYYGFIGYKDSGSVNVKYEYSGLSNGVIGNGVDVDEPTTWASGDIVVLEFEVPITGWSSGLDAVVQTKTLDKTTSNTLVAFSDAASDAISEENYSGWLTITSSTNTITYTYSGLGLEDPMNCSVTPGASSNNQYSYDIATSTNTSIVFNCISNNASTNCNNSNKYIRCEKTLRDVNKNVIQAATLQGINSSDLVVVEARGNLGTSLTANVTNIDFTETKDIQGAWNGTRFTALKTGLYLITGYVDYTANVSQIVNVWKNGVKDIAIGRNSSAISDTPIAGQVYLEKDEYMNFRINGSATLNNVSNHNIVIAQSADYEAIVKNLSLESDRCQDKILAANSTSVGDIITYNNLEIGKKYRMTSQVSADTGSFSYIKHNGVYLAEIYTTTNYIGTIDTGVFTATATTISLYQGNTTVVQGSPGVKTKTWAELCYKGNTVTTTEF